MAYGPTLDRARATGIIADGEREIAPWIERMARVGFAAKALLYATIGVLAARAAIGAGGATTDSRGALVQVLEAPFGRVLLGIIALGLVGYGVWRLLSAATDADGRGSDAKGAALRITGAALSVIHLALAYTAMRLALGLSRGGGRENGKARDAAGEALEMPQGEWLVVAAGALIVGVGIYQLYRAWAAKLTKQLRLGELSEGARRTAVAVSRFGIAARGVVLVLIGVLTVMAGMNRRPDVPGIAGALRTLMAIGRWPLLAVAVGFIAYACYDLLQARYRRIRAA
jgi:hypothetical protein